MESIEAPSPAGGAPGVALSGRRPARERLAGRRHRRRRLDQGLRIARTTAGGWRRRWAVLVRGRSHGRSRTTRARSTSSRDSFPARARRACRRRPHSFARADSGKIRGDLRRAPPGHDSRNRRGRADGRVRDEVAAGERLPAARARRGLPARRPASASAARGRPGARSSGASSSARSSRRPRPTPA